MTDQGAEIRLAPTGVAVSSDTERIRDNRRRGTSITWDDLAVDISAMKGLLTGREPAEEWIASRQQRCPRLWPESNVWRLLSNRLVDGIRFNA
jgi:hypothetical protein